MAIEGILLPLAVPDEFHGKYFLCVSDEFLDWLVTVWDVVSCDLNKGRPSGYRQLLFVVTGTRVGTMV